MRVSHSLQKLLTSQTRQKLIICFFEKPTELFYVRELVRMADEEINSVRRELDNLSHLGIILKEVRGNRLYYWANHSHYLFYSLVVLAHQHCGLGEQLIENRLKIGKVKSIFFSQNFLFNETSPTSNIDMMLIGDVSLKIVDDIVKKEEQRLSREINYMVMGKEEYLLRIGKRDPVLVDFFIKYPALVIGSPLDF